MIAGAGGVFPSAGAMIVTTCGLVPRFGSRFMSAVGVGGIAGCFRTGRVRASSVVCGLGTRGIGAGGVGAGRGGLAGLGWPAGIGSSGGCRTGSVLSRSRGIIARRRRCGSCCRFRGGGRTLRSAAVDGRVGAGRVNGLCSHRRAKHGGHRESKNREALPPAASSNLLWISYSAFLLS